MGWRPVTVGPTGRWCYRAKWFGLVRARLYVQEVYMAERYSNDPSEPVESYPMLQWRAPTPDESTVILEAVGGTPKIGRDGYIPKLKNPAATPPPAEGHGGRLRTLNAPIWRGRGDRYPGHVPGDWSAHGRYATCRGGPPAIGVSSMAEWLDWMEREHGWRLVWCENNATFFIFRRGDR